jgi:serine protease Do
MLWRIANKGRPMRLILAFLFATLISFQASAQNYDILTSAFDARGMTQEDKRFFQTALAFEGYYNGLLDGEWGTASQRAIDEYAINQSAESGALQLHAALLTIGILEQFSNSGWQMHYVEIFDMSVLSPKTAIRVDPASDFFLNFSHTKSTLKYSMTFGDNNQTVRLHEYTATTASNGNEIYTVSRPGLWITSATSAQGVTLYSRSDFRNGRWSTIMLSASLTDKSLLGAVASSISPGVAAPITVTEGGELDRIVLLAFELAEDSKFAGDQQEDSSTASSPSTRGTAQAPEIDQPAESALYSGTGFVVSEAGHVLTNAHVVENCSAISVNGVSASLIKASPEFDLALLESADLPTKMIASFAENPSRLNSDVTVVGFPLAGLLGGLNVTRGAVSSLTGLAGNELHMQITAPVQPGNSGGPVVAESGAVVGVVVSKLDAVVLSEAIGDIPQNVNFAIRGEIAKLFLSINGVQAQLSRASDPIGPEALAEMASEFTVYIECSR